MIQNLMQIVPDIVFNSLIMNWYEINQVICVYFDALQYTFQVAQYSFLPFLPQTKKKIVLSSARLLYEFLCFDPKWLFSSMYLWLIWWIWLIRRIMITSLLFILFFECKELFRYSFMHFLCLFFSIQKYAIDFFPTARQGINSRKWKMNFFLLHGILWMISVVYSRLVCNGIMVLEFREFGTYEIYYCTISQHKYYCLQLSKSKIYEKKSILLKNWIVMQP